MERYKNIDEKIRQGYELEESKQSAAACDVWLDAWEDIKGILAEEELRDIKSLETKYDWHEFLINYVQDLEMELGKVGEVQEEYLTKRIQYCEEMIEALNENDKLTIENTRRALADSHYALGASEECDRLYTQWLDDDPSWGWGHIGWSDCYRFGTDKIAPDKAKAEEILRAALEIEGMRDRIEVLLRSADIYDELGQPKKAKELDAEIERLSKEERLLPPSDYVKLFTTPDSPVTAAGRIEGGERSATASSKSAAVTKVGRNDPCPCGSGKKYKQCHGKE